MVDSHDEVLPLAAVLRDRHHRDPYHQTYELAQIAEEAGFDTTTTGHHHFMPGHMSDRLTAPRGLREELSGNVCRCTGYGRIVAVRTERLRVATGIFQLPVHHPLRVAEQVATIDELSDGRISLGVGPGWWSCSAASMPARTCRPPKSPQSRTREIVTRMQRSTTSQPRTC